MTFTSSSPTIPKPLIAIGCSSCDDPVDYGCASSATAEKKLSSPTLARHAQRGQQYGDNVHPSHSNSLQSVVGTVLSIEKGTTEFPSADSAPSSQSSSCNHSVTDVSEYINTCESYPLPVQFSPQARSQRYNPPPPVINDNPLPFLASKAEIPSEPKKHSPSFDFKRLNPQLVLQNSGSVARDHLASERTFLAYVRTSLALASAGVGIVQLFAITDFTLQASNLPMAEASRRAKRFAIPLGIVTLIFSLFLLFLGVFRYFAVQNALPNNMFPAARMSILFTSFVFGAFVVVVFGALLNDNMGIWW